MTGIFDVKFLSHGRKAQCQPDPKFPDGQVIDVSRNANQKCAVDVPYPAECIGAWMLTCKSCGRTVGITAAGRPDDPKGVIVDCKKRGQQ